MKAIIDRLQSEPSLDGIADDDFFVTPDENIVPTGATFPCIGVKDGDIDRERVAHNAEDHTLNVDLILFQLVKTEGDAMLAADPVVYSILDLADDVRAVLLDRTNEAHKLGISGMLDNFCPEETGSELLAADDLPIVRKTLSFWYLKRVYI